MAAFHPVLHAYQYKRAFGYEVAYHAVPFHFHIKVIPRGDVACGQGNVFGDVLVRQYGQPGMNPSHKRNADSVRNGHEKGGTAAALLEHSSYCVTAQYVVCSYVEYGAELHQRIVWQGHPTGLIFTYGCLLYAQRLSQLILSKAMLLSKLPQSVHLYTASPGHAAPIFYTIVIYLVYLIKK